MINVVAPLEHEEVSLKEMDRKAFIVFERASVDNIRWEARKWCAAQAHESRFIALYTDANIIKRIEYGRLQWAGHLE